jgi:hypothetical protein
MWGRGITGPTTRAAWHSPWTFKQLIGEVREPLPAAPGQVERYESVYVRHGVASLFLAFEPLAGWHNVQVTDTRTRSDWAYLVVF